MARPTNPETRPSPLSCHQSGPCTRRRGIAPALLAAPAAALPAPDLEVADVDSRGMAAQALRKQARRRAVAAADVQELARGREGCVWIVSV
jgi:hypothetical protein